MAEDFPHASVLEGVRFTAQVGVPNVVQGLFRRRRTPVAVASRAGLDGLTVGFLRGLRRSYGEGPLWIRVGTDEVLLVLGADGIRRVLSGSPDPFAADPPPKQKGMAHFQPEALTISRAPEWEPRRRFAESVLDTGRPSLRLRDRFAIVCEEETAKLLESSELDFDRFHSAVARITRRVILGDGAAQDEQLSEELAKLMDEANGMPSPGPSELRERFYERLEGYVEAAEPGSLVSLIEQAPSVEHPAGQLTHWLFALGDTLAINALRCLTLLATHRYERAKALEELAPLAGEGLSSGDAVVSLSYLGACLSEAMRLWPTTPILSRVAVRDTEWDGVPIPEGTQVMIVNTFQHRDTETHEYADRFSPEVWTSGDAAADWSLNHFSHGPQGCPGTAIAMFVGQAVLGGLLTAREVKLVSSSLGPGELPHMLDPFGLRFELTPRGRG